MLNVGACLHRGFNSGILLGESIEDRQNTYNVTPKRVREIIVAWKSNKYYVF